jgi:hypothetical protein
MRSLAGCVALAIVLVGGPAKAEDAMEQLAALRTAPAQSEVASLSSAALALEAGNATLTAPPPPPPPITLVLNADLGAQRLTVVENGKAKYTWPISSGRNGFATRTGTFHPQWASKMHYSRQYEYAPMPHAVFFNRGTAFHGTGAVGMLGRPASHGCIRLAPGNAAQLFKLVHKHGYQKTKVVVHAGPKRNEPAVARRSPGRSKGEYANAGTAARNGYRVSRYSAQRP